MSTKVKRINLTFNPVLQTHWIYKEFFRNYNENEKLLDNNDMLIVHTIYKHNKFLTDEDVWRLENEDNKYFRDVYTYGLWGVLGHLIFNNYKIMDLSYKKEYFQEIICGLDFGSTDPNAYIKTHFEEVSNTLYIFDAWDASQLTNDQIVNMIKKTYNNEVINADCAEPKTIQYLKSKGLYIYTCSKYKGSVMDTYKWLLNVKIIIDKNSNGVINEFKTHKWKTATDGTSIPIPEDKNNHYIDAIRYAIQNYMYYVDPIS